MHWPLWLELLVRSGVLLMSGEALRRWSKRRSPRFRHRLLVWVFAALVLLPVLSIMLPEIRVPVWPAAQPSGNVTVQQTSVAIVERHRAAKINWWLLIWLSGLGTALGPLVAGGLFARRLLRRAKAIDPGVWKSKAGELPPIPGNRKPEILLSNDVLVPLTCGILRPRIVLPAVASDWANSRLRAVLLHELAHVRRRDVGLQLCVHVIAALWWFQPLVWILRRMLRLESELACDTEALASGLQPSQYAAELLAVAKAAGAAGSLSSVGISMAQSGDLESRLRSVLDPPSAMFSRTHVWTAAIALSAVAILTSAVTAQSSSIFSEGDLSMKRTLISALLVSAGLSAATISGSIFDPSGAAIADAKILIYNPDTGAKQETVSSQDGKFTLEDAPSGECILRVEKAGYNSLLREFNLKPDSKIDRGLTLTIGPARQGVDSGATAQPDAPKRVRVGGEVAENNLTKKVQPVYPTAAKAAHVQGTVELEATISREGVPLELRVVSSPNEDLSEASLEAVRQWRYRPTLLNGNPVDIVTAVIINFTLSQ